MSPAPSPVTRHVTRSVVRPEGESLVDGTRLMRLVGGWSGLIDGALPPLAFVVVNAGFSPFVDRAESLRAAVIVAAGVTAGLVALRLRRGDRIQPLVRGAVGVLVAAAFAVRAGEARAYFLPGIWVDAAYAFAFACSALVGRPLVRTVHRWLHVADAPTDNPLLERAFTVTTLGWSLVFGVRAGTQAALYAADQTALLGLSKVALGWPLTVLAVLFTVRHLRTRVPQSTG